MASENTSTVGSGINPLKYSMVMNPFSQERHLRGTAIINLNPEDNSAGLAGRSSAVSVGTTATLIPTAPLVYRRAISVFNLGVIEIVLPELVKITVPLSPLTVV